MHHNIMSSITNVIIDIIECCCVGDSSLAHTHTHPDPAEFSHQQNALNECCTALKNAFADTSKPCRVLRTPCLRC